MYPAPMTPIRMCMEAVLDAGSEVAKSADRHLVALRLHGRVSGVAALPRGMISIGHDNSAGLGRRRLNEVEREPLVDAAEQRLPLAQDNRVNNLGHDDRFSAAEGN